MIRELVAWLVSVGVLGILALTAFWFVYWRRHVIWFDAEKRARLKAYECPGCLGYGEQILLPDPWRPEKPNGRPNLVWQPIPHKMRVVQEGINPEHTSSPHGNRRSCMKCHSIGHYWETEL